MIVDASALLAIILLEPERDRFLDLLDSHGKLSMFVVNFVEVAIKVDKDPDPRRARGFDEIVTSFGIEIAAIGLEQGRLARRAHLDFGRGSGHPARLNLGDCFAYALAKARGEPLLFKGEDFTKTDIEAAV